MTQDLRERVARAWPAGPEAVIAVCAEHFAAMLDAQSLRWRDTSEQAGMRGHRNIFVRAGDTADILKENASAIRAEGAKKLENK